MISLGKRLEIAPASSLVALAVFGAVGVGVLASTWPTACLGIFAIAALVSVARVMSIKRIDLLSPIVAFGGIYVAYNSIGLLDVPGFRGVMGLGSLQSGPNLAQYYALGFAGLLAGLCLGKSIAPHRPSTDGLSFRPLATHRVGWILICYALIGIVAAIDVFRTSGWIVPTLASDVEQARFFLTPRKYVADLLSFLPPVCVLAGVWLLTRKADERSKWVVIIPLILIVSLGTVLLFANRSALIWSIGPLLVAYHYLRRRFSLVGLAGTGAVVIAFLRGIELLRGTNLANTVSVLSESGVIGTIYATPRSTVETFAVFLRAIPQDYDFSYGMLTLRDWLVFLPGHRPDANAVTKDIVASVGYYVPSARPPGLVGAYYAEFGTIGVFLGVGVLAACLQILYVNMQASPGIRSVVVYAWWLTFALLGLYGLGLPIVSEGLVFAILLVGVAFSSRQMSATTVAIGLILVAVTGLGALSILQSLS